METDLAQVGSNLAGALLFAGLLGCLPAIMEEGQALVEAEGGDQDIFSGFKLPFKVATLTDVGQRAYINAAGKAEWVFARVHAHCKITQEPGRLLRLNQESIANELQGLQVPADQFHYKNIEEIRGSDAHWKDHTLESSALLVVLLWICKNRGLKAHAKMKSMALALDLLMKAFQFAGAHKPIMMMLTKPDGVLASNEQKFSDQGLCQTWGQFLRKCPGAADLWHKLGTRCWLNRCIASSADNALVSDIFFFLAYI